MCLGRRGEGRGRRERRKGEGFLAEVTAEHPTLRMSRGLSCRCDRQRGSMRKVTWWVRAWGFL